MNQKIFSPAKINLHLQVFEKGVDGYHRVETTMLKISLFDHLEIKIDEGEGIDVVVNTPYEFLSGPDNLVYRAAAFYLSKTQLKKKVSVRITKTIPLGAGLGGGSSNAGTFLCALNDLVDRPLSLQDLCNLGKQLGADVPFFIQNDDFAFLKGRGDEVFESSSFPPLPILVVYPNIHVATKDVYSKLGRSLTWVGEDGIHRACDRSFSSWKDIDFLLKKGNDLQPVTEAMHPKIQEIRIKLLEQGALFSQMSGSGASVFGLFDNAQVAQKAEQALAGYGPCFAVYSSVTPLENDQNLI